MIEVNKPVSLELNSRTVQPVSYDNPVFLEQEAIVPEYHNAVIVVATTPEADIEDEMDKNNVGFERLSDKGNRVGLFLYKIREKLFSILEKRKTIVSYAVKILLLVGSIIYFGFAMSKKYGTPPFPIRGNVFSGNAGFALFFFVLFAIFAVAWEKFLGRSVERLATKFSQSNSNRPACIRFRKVFNRFSWMGHILVLIAIAIYIGVTTPRATNLISLIGISVLIILGTLGSQYPHRIRWKTVFYSFVLQFILAAIVIRLEVGFQFFDFLGNEITKFIKNAEEGAKFVFGESFRDHYYIFGITSIIIFLGSVINVLYYLGAMQYIIGKIAWLMQVCLNTTAAESMNAAANIFVGMSEAPLMIMPLIPKMTTSELHAVLVGGFATMAGSVLATFISFGVPANHLIAASVMAAPGALGFAKLLLPETHQTKTSWQIVKNVPLPQQFNVIDALMSGAGDAMKICGYLIANLIAFISVLNFLDVTISWFFSLVHHPEVNFQFLLGLLFYPFALIIGIPLRDCMAASKLIGIKVSINEFIAYQELGKIRSLRNELMSNNSWPLYLNGSRTLSEPMLWEDSSLVILTYALCGFANFGAMGIALATLSVFAPERKRALVQIAPRALIGGNMVSLMTASIAGLLYNPAKMVTLPASSNSTRIY